MNRVELVALFTALDVLVKEQNIEGIARVVETVLKESESKKNDD